MQPRDVVVFEFGGVLIDWDPRHLYRGLFAGDEAAMEHFLATVCTHEWNRCQDAGRSFAEGARLLMAEHPDKAELIDAYHTRFDEMLAGPIAGSVEILGELRDRGTALYGLTNWSAETYPAAVERFAFLRWFRGILVSGEVGLIKPDPRIFALMIERFNIEAQHAVYIDDVETNAAAAASLGIHAIHFTTPAILREELVGLGCFLLAPLDPVFSALGAAATVVAGLGAASLREGAMAGLLDGKSALITGGGGGIGRATALAFAREGARVAVADMSAEAAGETVARVNAAGGQAMSLGGDVTRDADVRAMIEGLVGAYGRLDCAFNNAGIAGWQVEAAGKKTAEWSEEAFDRMVAVNLKGVWLCMRHELPQMQAQGGGTIVNTGSIAGLVGLPTSSAYVAAKHGVLGLTKTAAIEYAEANIRVNAVCPGYIETRMTEETMRRRGEAILAQVPFHRMGRPEEIAEMVVWLCSERASYVSGACYNVDGGWMAI